MSSPGRRRNLSPLDQIASYLADRPHGVSCTGIARRFLRMSDPGAAEAMRVVGALLRGDRRFVELGRGVWTAEKSGRDDRRADAPRAEEDAGGEGARLYGAARRSADGRTASIGLVRAEGGARHEHRYVQLLADPRCSSPEAAALSEGAEIVLFSTAGAFRFPPGAAPFRLRRWAEELYPDRSFRSIAELAAHLGHPFLEGEEALSDARLTGEIFESLRERHGAPSREEWEEVPAEEIPFLREGGEDLLAEMPDTPGVYRMRSAGGELLYVGQSRSLRRRLEGWFRGYRQLPHSKREMLRRVARVETEPAGSDLEAMIAEERAIRREDPRYNEQREVHAGPPHRAAPFEGILFLPAVDPRYVTLFLVRAGGEVARCRARRNTKKGTALRARLERFFGGGGGAPSPPAGAIVERWLHANRNRVTALERSRYASPEELLGAVLACLGDPAITGGERFEVLPSPPV